MFGSIQILSESNTADMANNFSALWLLLKQLLMHIEQSCPRFSRVVTNLVLHTFIRPVGQIKTNCSMCTITSFSYKFHENDMLLSSFSAKCFDFFDKSQTDNFFTANLDILALNSLMQYIWLFKLEEYCQRKTLQEKESIKVVRCGLKILSFRITVRQHSASLVMPNSYPCDGIFNLHLTTIKDSYNRTCFFRVNYYCR